MLRFFVARHGQNVDNANGILNGHRDLPLTRIGRDQARELSRLIRENDIKFDAIYSSPLMRARETADIIAKSCETPGAIILPDLIERDFWEMTGKSVSSIRELCNPDILETPTITYFLRYPGAENFDALYTRARTILDHLASIHEDGTILMVCHGDVGKMLMGAYFNIPWRTALEGLHFGNSELIELSSETNIENCRRVRIEQFNG